MTSDDGIVRDFTLTMRGYDRGEVDQHLRRTAAAVEGLRRQIGDLEERLTAARTAAERSRPDADAPASERFEALGAEAARILTAAEESATEMRDTATRQAEAAVAAAERAARERVDGATQHAARIVADAEQQRDAVLADAEERRLVVEAEITRLEGVRDNLVDDLRIAVAATVDAVAELAPATAADPDGGPSTAPASGDGVPDEAGPAPSADGAVPDHGEPAPVGEALDRGEDAQVADVAAEHDVAAEPGHAGSEHGDAVTGSSDEDTGSAASPTGPEPEPEPDEREAEAGVNAVLVRVGGADADVEDVDEDVDEVEVVDVAGADDEVVTPLGPGHGGRHGAAPTAVRSALADAAVAAGSGGDAAPDVPPTVRREQSLAPVRPGMVRRLRRGLQDLQNGVLRDIRARGDEIAESLLPDDDAVAALAALGDVFLDDGYRAGVADASVAAGGHAPGDPGADDAVVAEVAGELAADLVDELRTTLLPSLRAGIEAGEPDASLSERVGEVFRDLKGPIVETVVDRHLVRAYGRATIATWRAAGIDEVAWVVGDEARCPEGRCRTNAVEGPVALGERFSSGHALPPVHDGCTCALAPG